MEPEAREFLVRVAKSLSIVILWMLVNMTLGIFFHFGFIYNSISVANIIFYIFFITTLTALLWYLLKIWKESLQP
jgi:hypothetical protein